MLKCHVINKDCVCWAYELIKHMENDEICTIHFQTVNIFMLCKCGETLICKMGECCPLSPLGWMPMSVDLCPSDNDWSTRGCEDHRWLPSALVLRGFHKEAHQPDQKDLLRPAPAGSSDSQEDDGDHDPRGSDQRPEGSCQQAVSSHEFSVVSSNFFFIYYLYLPHKYTGGRVVNTVKITAFNLLFWWHGTTPGFHL